MKKNVKLLKPNTGESHGGAALAGALASDAGSGQAGHGPEAGHGAHGALATGAMGLTKQGYHGRISTNDAHWRLRAVYVR